MTNPPEYLMFVLTEAFDLLKKSKNKSYNIVKPLLREEDRKKYTDFLNSIPEVELFVYESLAMRIHSKEDENENEILNKWRNNEPKI